MNNKENISVLFVCMGNICRSPTAEGVFQQLVNQHALGEVIKIDSAGTHAYHVGNPPDRRAQAAALKRGVDLSIQRARRVSGDDFIQFDFILAMDQDNLMDLQEIAPSDSHCELSLFLDHAPHLEYREVPDPYYGGVSGFERVLDMIQTASEGLLEHIKNDRLRTV